MRGTYRRIKPLCDVTDCLYCEQGICCVLNDTSFEGECRWYKARKQAPVIPMPEKKEEPPKDFVGGQKYKIENMWRKKDE